MLLKSLKLENIRSYLDAKVDFPEGTVLFSGDVGCGKSTVLLAAEFALFGIQRGELSGSDLLRHGKDLGSVKLAFEVNGREASIQRTLKRDKKGVSQDACHIEIGGARLQKTAGEIRAFVLELLGYPFEYLNKNPIIYRYTVYTPQDEMKRILTADSNERLSIIRKILGIDKYGRIRDNAVNIVAKELRAMRRELDAASADMDARQKELAEKQKLLMDLGADFADQKAQADAAAKDVKSREQELESTSRQIRELSKLKEDIARMESSIREKEQRNRQIQREVSDVEARLGFIEDEIREKPAPPTELSESEILKRKRDLEKKKSELSSEKSVLESELRKLQSIFTRGRCDFCEQSVADPASYKARIEEKSDRMSSLSREVSSASEELVETENIYRKLLAFASVMSAFALKEKDRSEKKAFLSARNDELRKNKAEMIDTEEKLVSLKAKASALPELESAEKLAKSALAAALQKKSEAERALARTESQIESLTRECNRAETDIAEKRKKKEKSEKIAGTIAWLEDVFIPLMETMEKSVMLTVQDEFNGFFQKWFSILMGSESLSVRVDDRFAPMIEQESYETEYANLSGGEKTAVALAYRLALNKVINSLIETIRTKDLIILDEPTDGFSADQIDRIRNVLEELNLRQMIIVSHEPKVDTFVDSVVKFHKEGHVSRVVN